MVKRFGKFFRRGDIDKVKYDTTWDMAQRIKNKIIKASKNPYNIDIFGAEAHKFKLKEVASLEEVERFEKNNNIILPKDYRNFILKVGNGGVGPYYGIKKLDVSKIDKNLSKECILRPDMTTEEWKEITNIIYGEDVSDEDYDEFSDECYDKVYGGLLYLGTQGCTYNMMLVLNGPYKGKVIYTDDDGNKPFFTYESNFIDWYERWLDEIINGYEIFWFGTNMGGNEKELIGIYNSTKDKSTRVSAIYGMGKLREITDETVTFLENIYLNEDNAEAKSALQMLAKHKKGKAKKYIIRDLEGDYGDVLIALKLINWYYKEDSSSFIEAVENCFLKQDIIDKELLKYMNYVLSRVEKDYSEEYKKLVYSDNDELSGLAIYFLGKAKDRYKYLEEFKFVLKSENIKLVNSSLQGLKGIKDESLIPYYKHILDKYEENIDSVLTNVIKRLGEQGGSVIYILEDLKKHKIKEVKAEAYRTLNILEETYIK
ncbi:SMI1 / KNR4 family (SUKH-1) [Clostridium cavendishii DSM 21758]|uniref:SMI1 / KNR4 family (SUKH-1) n=1 Tax=Clostridium cavendishii DSM 21758 TaxID=1121302 RepID=A0A1M6GW98_9CLOT|nr:SMI1/KNR4 family protein [Clostridium cavendishii]SHJ14221.1 SMI1 / KNR4 family (SUKH-1) [Clostridium cavendishii DSM 21758]